MKLIRAGWFIIGCLLGDGVCSRTRDRHGEASLYLWLFFPGQFSLESGCWVNRECGSHNALFDT